MSGHTKEPWEHVETRVYLGNDGGFDLRDAPSPEANARRIVAAVNACAGLSCDDLKNGLTVIDAARSYLWQRNNLLAAMKLLSGMKLGMVADGIVDKALAEVEASK